MAATQWLYSPVSTNVSEKTGILEIACCEMRNLVPPVAPGEDPMSDNFLSVREIDTRIAFARENLR